MKIRADIVELLNAGYGDTTIARRTQVPRTQVARAREALGLPPGKSGNKAAASVEDLFWRRAKPVDGGHMEWDGYRNKTATPAVRYGGRLLSAYRIAFRIKHGREPEGYALPCCGHDGCVMPGHHEDRLIRERTEATFAAIFGEAA